MLRKKTQTQVTNSRGKNEVKNTVLGVIEDMGDNTFLDDGKWGWLTFGGGLA